MTSELDALLIRNVSDLNDAANRLDMLSEEVGRAVDREIAAWTDRNGWRGRADFHGKGTTWLALPDWMIPDHPNEGAYLYLQLVESGGEPANQWHVASYLGRGTQSLGFWLYSDAMSYAAVKRLHKVRGIAAGLPTFESEFFLQLSLDQDELVAAVEAGAIPMPWRRSGERWTGCRPSRNSCNRSRTTSSQPAQNSIGLFAEHLVARRDQRAFGQAGSATFQTYISRQQSSPLA